MTKGSTIVVSGLPGAGKTTLGRALAGQLSLPFLDKDDILEDLFGRDADPAARRAVLSREADTMLMTQAARHAAVVLVSFWRRPELSTTSGTPTDWLRDRSDVVELWCDCLPDIAAARFLQRTRHPAHGDGAKRPDEAVGTFEQLAALGPLGIGRLVRVDTSEPVDVTALVRRITTGDGRPRR